METKKGLDLIVSDIPEKQALYPVTVVKEEPYMFPSNCQTGILLDEPFNCFPQVNGGLLLNGWNLVDDGGGFSCQYTGLCMIKEDRDKPVYAEKGIPMVLDDCVTFEMILAVGAASMNGCGFTLFHQTEETASVFYDNGALCLRTAGKTFSLTAYVCNQPYGIRLTLNPVDKTVSIYLDGKSVGDFPYSGKCADCIRLDAGSGGTGFCQIVYLSAYTGYAVFERFFTALNGNVPDDWHSGGKLSIVELPIEENADCFSLQMSETAYLTKKISPLFSPAHLSFSFFIRESADFHMVLSGHSPYIRLETDGDDIRISVKENDSKCVYQYRKGIWFHIELCPDIPAGLYYLQINYKTICSFPLSVIRETSTLHFENRSGSVLLDDIVLNTVNDYPDDYVPEPMPTDTGEYMVGMLCCDLWRSTNHLGWDRVNGFDGGGRKPLMGWYEDGNPEAADWEIKYLSEHGISFRMPCWYRPQNTVGKPFKRPLHAEMLHDGYFYARYKDKIHFSVFLTNARGEISGSRDFRENIVPYFIEYYFKDPNYMVIDNKPLIGLYDYRAFRDDMGGDVQAAEEMEYVKQCCRDIGFDGALFISSLMALQTADNQEIYNGGTDLTCAYGWGIVFSDSASGQYAISKDTRDYEGVKNLVTPMTLGFDFYPWERSNASSTIPEEEFSMLCQTMKTKYMSGFPKDSVLSRLVLLDNWNEYSEGHAFSPSVSSGFRYLDILRNAFTTSEWSHTDIMPSEAQQTRMGLLYNPTRQLIHAARYPTVPMFEECTEVLWKWNVVSGQKVYPVSFENRCGSVIREENALRISCANNRNFAVIRFSGLQVDAEQVAYLKLHLQGNTMHYNGRVYFAVDGMDIDYAYQSRKMTEVCFDKTKTEYSSDIGKAVLRNGTYFQGILTELEIWFFSGGEDILLTDAELIGCSKEATQ